MGKKITREMLVGWNACKSGMEWFDAKYPNGSGEYQDILNGLAEDDRPNDAEWLMDRAGADDSLIEVDSIDNVKHFFAAGSLVIKAGAVVAGAIRAGEGIKAGWGIEAGSGWAIFAGLRVNTRNWSMFAKVTARIKPENLFGGTWVEPSSEQKEAA